MHDEAHTPEGPPPERAEELQPLTITLGEQVFRLRVPAAELTRYRRAAALADATLREILASGVVGGARALAMTAFELAAELEEARERLRQSREERLRLDRLIHRLEGVLDRAGQG